MRTHPVRALALFLSSVAWPVGAAAQSGESVNLEAIRSSKRVSAVRIAEAIRIDGILDDPVWQGIAPATDFYQQQPAEFSAATRRTEVRFAYDDDTLYLGAMMFDDEPDQLITNDLRRDFNGSDGDLLGLIIDTFQDRRNSYGFLTNPGGAQRETQAYDNGRRNDANWHGVWFVRTAVLENGWSAEFAIPFKTLRFPARPDQEWGLNVVRIVRRINERSTWSPVPRQFSHYNVAYAGTLDGVRGVQPGRNFWIKPFATSDIDHRGALGSDWDPSADGGVDLKWGITSQLVLDGTWRTDFSQVETDAQQINLTRFTPFFPEKREFFLESPASFQIGLVESDGDDQRRDLVPFFSRRIGLSSAGQPIPVIGGVRVTGRAGAQGVGFLTMQTDDFEARPGDNFTAARLTRPVSGTTTVGGFYFGRESTGGFGFNRVGGFDLRITPKRTFEIEAFAMNSTTENEPGDWAGRTGFRVDGNAHRARAGLVYVGDHFRHDLGFVRRRGIATLFGRYARILRPGDSSGVIREHSLGADIDSTTDAGFDRRLTQIGSLDYGIAFADGGQFTASVNGTFERLDEAFDIGSLTVDAGDYKWNDLNVSYESNPSAALSGSLSITAGQFWSGTQRVIDGSARLRFNAHFAVSGTLGVNLIELPEGSFDGTLVGLRVDWSFTPRMFLNAFIQYNGETDTVLSNIRYNFIHRPLSDIYVVWNETRLPGLTRRALLFKYTQLLSF